MITDNDKCPACGAPVKSETELGNAIFCGIITPAYVNRVYCTAFCGFKIAIWSTVSLDTFTATRRKLEERNEEEYRAIVERSERATM